MAKKKEKVAKGMSRYRDLSAKEMKEHMAMEKQLMKKKRKNAKKR